MTQNSDPASTTDARDTRGRWKAGQSGNPAGKAPHNVSRRLLMENAELLTQKAIERALEGDTAALNLCLSRIAPALKQQAAPIQIDMPSNNLLDQAQRLFRGATDGTIAPDIAGQLLQGLNSVSRVQEVDNIEQRLALLEKEFRDAREEH